MKPPKFISKQTSDMKGYIVARFNEITGQYETIRMTPGQQELIARLVCELNLEYNEECDNFQIK